MSAEDNKAVEQQEPSAVRIPPQWQSSGPQRFHTRSEMLAARKREFRADKTFDLDGDGAVSERDYFFAKVFDRDRDGKLNETERKNALEALKQKFADNFSWTEQGVHKATEVDIANRNQGWFQQVNRATPRGLRTRSKMNRQRQRENFAALEDGREQYERLHPRFSTADDPRYTRVRVGPGPAVSSHGEQVTRRKEDARVAAGLAPHTIPINTEQPRFLASTYVREPKHKTRSAWLSDHHRELADANIRTAAEAETYFVPAEARREAKHMQHLKESSERRKTLMAQGAGRTRSILLAQRKAEAIATNSALPLKLRGNPKVPTLPDDRPYFVGSHDGPADQDALYFALPEEVIQSPLRQVQDTQARTATLRERAKAKRRVAPKVGVLPYASDKELSQTLAGMKPKRVGWHEKFFAHKGQDHFKKQSKIRGSHLKMVDKWNAKKAAIAEQLEEKREEVPMFSSFSHDGIFREPRYGPRPQKVVTPLYQANTVSYTTTNIRPQTAAGVHRIKKTLSQTHMNMSMEVMNDSARARAKSAPRGRLH